MLRCSPPVQWQQGPYCSSLPMGGKDRGGWSTKFLYTGGARSIMPVEANGVAVRAVGTAFDVRLVGASVEVLVTEGTVQVHPPVATSAAGSAPTAVVNEGQKTVVSTRSQNTAPVVESVPSTVLDQALAWQSSRFVFDAMPLADVVERFNRSGTNTVLVLDDPGLAALKFSGRLRAAPVDRFVEVLEANFGIRAERRSDGRIILRRAQ